MGAIAPLPRNDSIRRDRRSTKGAGALRPPPSEHPHLWLGTGEPFCGGGDRVVLDCRHLAGDRQGAADSLSDGGDARHQLAELGKGQ